MLEPRSKIELARKAGLLMLSLVLSALALEILWRVYVARRFAPVTVYDEELGWRFEADVVSRQTSADFDVEIRTDSRGHRVGRDASADSARLRVVFVGDSATFGWGVEVEESFPFLVGRMLDVDVVNLGVSGYGTDQQYLKLRRDGLPLGPDAVVLTFSDNDPEEVASEWRYGWTKPRFRREDSRLKLSPAAERSPFLERHSSVYRSLKFYRELHSSSPGLGGPRLAEARRLVSRLIRSMAEESRAAGAGFFVVHSGADWLVGALGGDVARLVDVGPALREAAREGPVSFASDPHWNARGHGVVAGRLAAALERFLAPGSPAEHSDLATP